MPPHANAQEALASRAQPRMQVITPPNKVAIVNGIQYRFTPN